MAIEVEEYPIPIGTALEYFAKKRGYYTDCFATKIDCAVALPDYVEAFYTTTLFKAERLVLRVIAKVHSNDQDVLDLALGETDRFAVWRVEERTETQLLMKAIGRTASWFMIENTDDDNPGTRLFFGSIVAPKDRAGREAPPMGPLYSTLLGAHRIYSKLLLASARRRLQRVNRVSDTVAT